MTQPSDTLCITCGGQHARDVSQTIETCPVAQQAVSAGAHPRNVPPRIYSGYMDARAALRDNTPTVATQVLQRVLGQIAVECGADADAPFVGKMGTLCDQGVISPRLRTALLDRAFAAHEEIEQAWALMSVAEHTFYRLYLTPRR